MKKIVMIAAAFLASTAMIACSNASSTQNTQDEKPACCQGENSECHCQKQDGKHHRGPRHGNPAERVEMMAKELSLTDEQKAALVAYYNEQDSVRHANRPDKPEMKEGEKPEKPTEEQMEARKAEMEAQRAADEAKLKEILTDEQYTKYQEMLANRPDPKDGPGRPQERPQGE